MNRAMVSRQAIRGFVVPWTDGNDPSEVFQIICSNHFFSIQQKDTLIFSENLSIHVDHVPLPYQLMY